MQVNDGPCVMYVGDGGAGNYVKMVHNGIEYGDMQVGRGMHGFLCSMTRCDMRGGGGHAGGVSVWYAVATCRWIAGMHGVALREVHVGEVIQGGHRRRAGQFSSWL